MKDNISPEEKLLRLIKKDKAQGAAVANVAAVATDSTAVISPDKKNLPYTNRNFKINSSRLLLAAFLFSCLYFIFSLTYPFLGLNKINLPKTAQNTDIALKGDQKQVLKPIEFYLAGIKDHQILSRSNIDEAQQTIANLETDETKDMALIGVIFDSNPQAIVQDKKLHKTYYLRKGQFLGSFQIEDVQEGRILLDRAGEKYELHL